MIRDEIVNLIIAITKMIEARTTHVEVNTEYDRVRMIDFRKHVEKQGLHMEDDSSSCQMILRRTGNESSLEAEF